MKFTGKIKAFNGIRMGIRKLLINFFAKRDDDTVNINFNRFNDTLRIVDGTTTYYVNDDLDTVKSFDISGTGAQLQSIVEHDSYYYVTASYDFSGNDRGLLFKFDSNYNLVWDAQIDTVSAKINYISFTPSGIVICMNDPGVDNSVFTQFAILDYATGNQIFRRRHYYEDYDNGSYGRYLYYPSDKGFAGTTSNYIPMVVYVKTPVRFSGSYGDVAPIIFDLSSRRFRKIDLSSFGNFGNQISSADGINMQSSGDYYGGSLGQSRIATGTSNTYYDHKFFVNLKINSDDTFDAHSLRWSYNTANDYTYYGNVAAVNPNGELMGIVDAKGHVGTQYENYRYDVIFIMPWGTYNTANVSDTWVIEADAINKGFSVTNLEFTTDYAHIEYAYNDSGTTRYGIVSLNIQEIRSKDSIDLGQGFTLVKANQSSFYNYVSTQGELNELYGDVAGSVDLVNEAINANLYADQDIRIDYFDYGSDTFDTNYVDPQTFGITSPSSTALDITKGDLKDR